ncbi:glycosyltransferase [Methylobacterium planeticum]|uniref:Glycosyltransferase family 4 protein n=1 Tax=Methylobacterium planeticum TaxID=2615211 RepID=A0A6N6MZS0_9HYPH|nr:glycosyltransferase [Methylobacterium planeticum]KAB1075205.1 glycosyltransferase family 4 protein [Methylobacterium planeticum]
MTPRRVYVDQTHLRGHVTGIERVARDLFAPGRLAPHPVRALSGGNVARMIAEQQFGLPLRGLADRAALMIFPGFPPGPLCALLGERCILYVHDTFLITRPQDLSWKSRLYMAPSFRLAMRYGRRFLVNSRTTGEALRAVCAPRALVATLRPAVSDVFGLGALAGPAPYRPGAPLRLLAIGTIEPRKDYPAALALTAALNAAGLPAELHVVGRVGWGRHAFLEAPPAFLRLHGYVDDAGLRQLAESCHALVSTSKAEGLGLPLLEVQHGGLPVIAPEGPVFREVLGGSGLFIRPEDPVESAARVGTWLRAGGLAAPAGLARENVARWNALAAADADRFRAFLSDGPSAYAAGGTVPPGEGAAPT